MSNNYSFSLGELNKKLEDEFGFEEGLEEEDLEEMQAGELKQSSFPTIPLAFAVLKDFVDLVSLGAIGTLINVLAWIVIRLYLFRKVGFIKKWLYRRYIFTLILEFIPFINCIPQWTIFVLRAYATEKKRINQIFTAIEELIK